MQRYFLDTSAFAKLYHQDAGSQYVEKIVDQEGSGAVVSRLILVEIESVIAIKVRTGELDVSGQELFRRRLRADFSQGRVRVGPPVEEKHYQSARRLLVRYGARMGLRTLDALQLAIALELHRTGAISVLVVADQKLCLVAETCGCWVINPCDPGVTVL